MKTLFTLLIAAAIGFAAAAQDKAAPVKQEKAAPSKETKAAPAAVKPAAKKYWCTQCDFSSPKAATCPHHKNALVKEGMYFCKGDEANASAAQGTCSDGGAMTKMDMAYRNSLKPAIKKMEEKRRGER